jgi:hypothetical protein
VLIDDLISQYGPGGIVSIDAYHMGDGLEDWRYVVSIDGTERPDLDVRSLAPPSKPAMTIVDDQGRELVAWAWTLEHPRRILRTLQDLREPPRGA